MGPFKVLACPAPSTYRLDIPVVWRICPEFNVERLRPYLRCPAVLGGEPPPPPVATPDGALEHHDEVQELLKFKMRYGRPHVLVL